jgi:hypothetical protein
MLLRGYLPSRLRRNVFGRWNDTLVRGLRDERECTPWSAAFFAVLAFASGFVAVHSPFSIPLYEKNGSAAYFLRRQLYPSYSLWQPFLKLSASSTKRRLAV